MPTILKSFQYSLFIHLVLGTLFVISIPKEEKTIYQIKQNKMIIHLTGLKVGTNLNKNLGHNTKEIEHRKSNTVSNSLKKSSPTFSDKHNDHRSERSDNVVGSGSPSTEASLAKGSGGGTSDFNESIINYFEPQYPKVALRRGLQGELKVKILVGSQGVPIETQILQSSGHKILDDSALEAVNKWVFKTRANNTYYIVKTIIFQIKT